MDVLRSHPCLEVADAGILIVLFGIQGIISPAIAINASIIQGSSIGPTSYVINAWKSYYIILGNKMHMYAVVTYLLVPSNNSQLIQDELDHIEGWSTANNLRFNRSKSTVSHCNTNFDYI